MPTLLTHSDIAALIPHAGNMCLLDTVEEYGESHIICTAVSHTAQDHPLRLDGRLPALCGIEYAAQAMAVHGRLQAAVPAGKPAKGYLASIRDYRLQVQCLDDIEVPLRICAEQLLAEGSHFMYGFTITAAGVELMSGRAAVVQEAG